MCSYNCAYNIYEIFYHYFHHFSPNMSVGTKTILKIKPMYLMKVKCWYKTRNTILVECRKEIQCSKIVIFLIFVRINIKISS